jgi:hypothetical protein
MLTPPKMQLFPRPGAPSILRGHRLDALALWALLLAAAAYCHRFYGVDFALEGDALMNVYVRLHEDLARSGYNPYQWDYVTSMSFTGLGNPVALAVSAAWDIAAPSGDPLVRALGVNMLTSVLSLTLLSWGVYLLLRIAQASRSGSVLGAVVVSYTGFHLVGVREFDHLYLLSFLCVPPTLICLMRIAKGHGLGWAAGAGLLIGGSLLGGSNAPMFYYLPFLCLLPFFRWVADRDPRALLRGLLLEALAVLIGLLIASPVLLPEVLHLEELNRSGIVFRWGFDPSISFKTLFLGAWWPCVWVHYHERDCFLGLPVLILTAVGFRRIPWRDGERRDGLLAAAMVACLAAALLICHIDLLPAFLEEPIAWFFRKQSIRNPPRFFLLLLLPVAYLSARGFDQLKGRTALVAGSLLSILTLALIGRFLGWPFRTFLPDERAAACLSLTSAFLATGALGIRWFCLSRGAWPALLRPASALAVAGIYAMFALAPIQLTVYRDWYLSEGLVQGQPEGRLALPRLLGLKAEYGQALARARQVFLSTPSYLALPETRQGRILHVRAKTIARQHHHAPQSGQRFFFDAVSDPATPRRIRDLYRRRTPDILDLCHIAWMVKETPGPLRFERGVSVTFSDLHGKPALWKRPDALPEGFLVPNLRVLESEGAVLDRMTQCRTSDFLVEILVDAREPGLSDLPNTGRALFPFREGERPLETLESSPGHMAFRVPAGRTGYLFLSIPYHSGWKARVNGRAVPLIRANYAFLAVPLPAEEAEVTLAFQRCPPAVRILSWGAALGAALLSLVAWQRSRGRSQEGGRPP